MVENAPPGGVLDKVVRILSVFGPDDHALPLAEIVTRTVLSKTTTHRLLADLVATGLLERDSTGGYRLGGRLFELGMRASVELRLMEIAIPFLQDLYERTRETVHLAERRDIEVVYVAKIGGHRQARAPSRIGGRMPMHCTAIGKALLAYEPELIDEVVAGGLRSRTPRTVTGPGLLRGQLKRVAETGVAFEYEESSVGLVCVAAPVLDWDDHPVAAVSIAGPVARFRPEQHQDAVRAAAAGIAATLARRARPMG